jgi:DNA repair protein RecN (Recombination protein N)
MIGEDDSLKEEKRLLENSRRIRETADFVIHSLLEDDGSAIEKIGEAQKALGAVASASESIREIAASMREASEALRESLLDLKNLTERLEDDPTRLETVNERLEEVFRLKKKYGSTIDDILSYGENARSELENLKSRQIDTESLKASFDQSSKELNSLANEMSLARRKEAPELEKQIMEKLVLMGIPRAQFRISITDAESENGVYEKEDRRLAGDALGFDVVEFQFCANPGEGLKPLARIASGGEISRVMLALKNAFLKKKEAVCEVFDEIDVGISGDIADRVAKQLKELSRKHQVLCITHLAQIASRGDHHYRVFKTSARGRSVTRVQRLNEEERIREIAGLISGEKITPKSLAGAEELLRSAADNSK